MPQLKTVEPDRPQHDHPKRLSTSSFSSAITAHCVLITARKKKLARFSKRLDI
jgi:hypothetical protein